MISGSMSNCMLALSLEADNLYPFKSSSHSPRLHIRRFRTTIRLHEMFLAPDNPLNRKHTRGWYSACLNSICCPMPRSYGIAPMKKSDPHAAFDCRPIAELKARKNIPNFSGR